MTLDAVVDPSLAAVMSVWLPIFTASQESTTGPALFETRYRVNGKIYTLVGYMVGTLTTTQIRNTNKYDLPTICTQATPLSFTFADGLAVRMSLSSKSVEEPLVRRLVVFETILVFLLTITTCRQTAIRGIHHSSSVRVESKPGLLAFCER